MVDTSKTPPARSAESHPTYAALRQKVEACLYDVDTISTRQEVESVFRQFESELKHICAISSLSESERLTEAEVVVGTILAESSQPRRRSEAVYKMDIHVRNLEAEVKEIILRREWDKPSPLEAKRALEFAWSAWRLTTDDIARMDEKDAFGRNSFALLMLDTVLECLESLNEL